MAIEKETTEESPQKKPTFKQILAWQARRQLKIYLENHKRKTQESPQPQPRRN